MVDNVRGDRTREHDERVRPSADAGARGNSKRQR